MYERLSQIECKVERRGNAAYVSWAEAWGKLVAAMPGSTFEVHLGLDGTPLHLDSMGAWVSVSVTVGEVTHREWLPVLDHRNAPIAEPNPFQTNKAIKRCLTKAIALHGLGLYVYQGEDLPDVDHKPDLGPLVTTPQLKNLHRLGKEYYGDSWDDKRHALVRAVSQGRTASSKELTEEEAVRLIVGLQDKIETVAAWAAVDRSPVEGE